MTNILQIPMTPKIGGTLAADVTRLNGGVDPQLSPVLEHAVMIGLKNIFQDCHASVTVDKHGTYQARVLSIKLMDAKLDSMYAGKVNARFGIRTPKADPIAKEARRIAQALVDKLTNGWEKPNTAGRRALEILAKHYDMFPDNAEVYPDEMKKVRIKAISDHMTKPEVVAEATRNVNAAKDGADDVLAALGLKPSVTDEEPDTDEDMVDVDDVDTDDTESEGEHAQA